MDKLLEILGKFGFVLMILGAAAMDSENMMIPAGCAIVGVLLLYLYGRSVKFDAEK